MINYKIDYLQFHEDYRGFLPTGIYINEKGKENKKTPFNSKYSYDSFVLWRGGKNDEYINCLYNDRLSSQYGHGRIEELSLKFPKANLNSWNTKSPEQIEKLLRELLNKKDLKLILIMEHCHAMSGYPLWSYHIKY